ncbi:MAG: type II secretion system protein [Candidatus Omnitrophica bacterium]|nr:type II secretion system protein [Candidatus Omnitrophota bacterium]
MKNLPSQNGFSLIELLVSSIVITIIGAAAYSANSALMQANEVNRNNVIGVNFLRKSIEEVRQAVKNNFDDIGQGTCQFGAGNSCGFDPDTTKAFPGFTRRPMIVQSVSGSTELKRITITVDWKDFGKDRSMTSVLYLSRPSATLPGNLVGLAYNKDTKQPVAGVDIVATRINPARTLPTLSAAAVFPAASDNKDSNYSFLNPAGQYQMETGSWNLTARVQGYLDYNVPSVDIKNNEETRENLPLTPVPDATINVVFNPSGAPAGFSAPFGKVGLYKEGSLFEEVDSAGSHTFTISFTDEDQQCFTVATRDLYKSGYAGGFSCSPPQSQDPRGWSSAVVADNGALSCSKPWNGSSASGVDRICVKPGDTKSVNVPLNPVAVRTITGFIRDQNAQPIANAPINILWHDGGNYPWPGKTTPITANSSGFYTAVVPALQELFPNSSANYLRLSSSAVAPIKNCCDITSTTTVTGTIRPGPLFRGNALASQDMVLATALITRKCGDARGSVRDAKTTSLLGSVSVNLSRAATTNAGGAYLYQCAAGVTPPYSIIANSYTMTASKSGYYTFSTAGNSVYSRLNSGTIAIAADVVNTVGDVGLWPQGFGRINVTVLRQGTSTPISNAAVSVSGPTNTTLSSGPGGVYAFNNILETWPVPEVVGNPKFNQTARQYSIRVTHSAYEDSTPVTLTLSRNETKDVTISMSPKGGM